MQIRGIIRRKKERNRMTLEELPSPPRGKICCPPGEQTEWNCVRYEYSFFEIDILFYDKFNCNRSSNDPSQIVIQ